MSTRQQARHVPRQGITFWRRIVSEHPWRRTIVLVLLGLVLEYLVLPQVAGVRRSLHLLGQVKIAYVVLGVLLEVASLASYAQLTKTVLPGCSVGFSRIWRIDLSTLAVSHVLPGGTAGGEGLAYRLLTNEGVSGGDVGLALAAQGIGSAIVLNVILWLALVVSIPTTGFNALYAVAAVIGALLLGAFAALVLLLTKGEERAADWMRRFVCRLPFVHERVADSADKMVHQVAARIRVMSADRPLLLRAVGWAAANWLLDAASLYVFLFAFGKRANPVGLLVAYGLAYVLAAIPVTPGGLGVVEGILVPTLVGFGATRQVAIVAVLAYRLVNFWLPIPVGAVSYFTLSSKDQRRAGKREKLSEALTKLMEEKVS